MVRKLLYENLFTLKFFPQLLTLFFIQINKSNSSLPIIFFFLSLPYKPFLTGHDTLILKAWAIMKFSFTSIPETLHLSHQLHVYLVDKFYPLNF